MTQIEAVPNLDPYRGNNDSLALFCAIMDKILERDFEVPNEIIGRLIEEIKSKL